VYERGRQACVSIGKRRRHSVQRAPLRARHACQRQAHLRGCSRRQASSPGDDSARSPCAVTRDTCDREECVSMVRWLSQPAPRSRSCSRRHPLCASSLASHLDTNASAVDMHVVQACTREQEGHTRERSKRVRHTKEGEEPKVTVVVVPPYVELSFFSRGTSKQGEKNEETRCTLPLLQRPVIIGLGVGKGLNNEAWQWTCVWLLQVQVRRVCRSGWVPTSCV